MLGIRKNAWLSLIHISSQCRYLKIELENLQKLFLNNDFYEYYRVGRTELDSRYFIRENYDILSDIHCHLLDRDCLLYTSRTGAKVSAIISRKQGSTEICMKWS